LPPPLKDISEVILLWVNPRATSLGCCLFIHESLQNVEFSRTK
jgi:hypothetical protein